MTVNAINNNAFSDLSALDGRTLSTLTAVNGQTIDSGGGFTPTDIPNIWMWGEPWRDGVASGLSDNDPMPQLTDQSGNGRHWTESDGSRKPLFDASQINGLGVSHHSVASGNGKGWRTGPNMSGLTAGHIFIIVALDFDPPPAFDSEGLWSMSNNLGEMFPQTVYRFVSDSGIYDGWGSTTRKTAGNPGGTFTNYKLYEVISTSSEWTAKMDGTQFFTTGTNTVGFLSTPKLGMSEDGSGQTGLVGKIAGVYIFSAKKTGSDRSDLITYINGTFATSYT